MQPRIDTPPVSRSLAALAGKYVTFMLGGESCGILALQVREIIRLIPVTAVPRMPGSIKGVINLRGRIIPIADLREALRLSTSAPSERACIIVVQIRRAAGSDALTGLIVDAVEEVANVAESELEPPPEFTQAGPARPVLAMAKLRSGIKTLLDVNHLLNAAAGPLQA
jgi:purine-binding chemotaxis protein CheW